MTYSETFVRRVRGQSSLLARMALPGVLALAASIISLASLGCSSIATENGVTAIGIDENGELVVQLTTDRRDFSAWNITRDDESDWSLGDRLSPDMTVRWGGASVSTTLGTYDVAESEVTFRNGATSAVVYSTGLTSNRSYAFLHNRATDIWVALDVARDPFGLQPSIVYDESRGTVVVAHGVQGILLEDSDGSWRRNGVGRFVPIDIDPLTKTRIALGEIIWLSITLSICVIAFVSVFVAFQHQIGSSAMIYTFIGCFAIVVATGVIGFVPFDEEIVVGMIFLGIHVLTGFAGLFAWVSTDGGSNALRIATTGTLAALSTGLCIVYVGWVFVGTAGEILIDVTELIWFLTVPLAGAFLALFVAKPAVKRLAVFSIAAGLMTLFFVFPFYLWINDRLDIFTTKFAALSLVAVIAIALYMTMKTTRQAEKDIVTH